MKAVTMQFAQMLHEVGVMLDVGMVSVLDQDKRFAANPAGYIDALQHYQKDGHELRHDDALERLLTEVTGLGRHTIDFAKNLSHIGIALKMEKLKELNSHLPDGFDGKWQGYDTPSPDNFGRWKVYYSTCLQHYKHDNLADEHHAPLMAFLQTHTQLSVGAVEFARMAAPLGVVTPLETLQRLDLHAKKHQISVTAAYIADQSSPIAHVAALLEKQTASAAVAAPPLPQGRPQLTFRPRRPLAKRVSEADHCKSGAFNLFCDTPPASPDAPKTPRTPSPSESPLYDSFGDPKPLALPTIEWGKLAASLVPDSVKSWVSYVSGQGQPSAGQAQKR